MANKLVCLLVVFACTLPLHAAECGNDLTIYNGYTVRQVRLWTPINFVTAATFGFHDLKARLPLQEEKPFSLRALSEGNVLVRQHIDSLTQDAPGKAKFVVVLGDLENCDPAARTVGVVYRIFTNIYRPSFSYTFEQRTAELNRPSATSAQGGTLGRILVRPLFGYDNTRRSYGGVDFSSSLPFAGFKSMALHNSFSSNSIDAAGSLSGSWRPGRGAMDHADLQFGFRYLDNPAGAAKLQESKLTARFLAASRPIASSDAIFRYGASLEGGHQQSTTPGQPLPSGVAANSGYGAGKFYLGTTARFGQQAFTASYGLQAGSTLSGSGIDFLKHIVDLGYSTRFLKVPSGALVAPSGKVHTPFDLELRATAGTIQQMGSIPAAERFFGGNQVEPFLTADNWIIPGGAYIRSIPQNRLGGLAVTGGLGGTHFYSGNVTIARVIWGRPLVPDELASDARFVPELNTTVDFAKQTLFDYYLANDPAAAAAYQTATTELDGIAATMQQVSDSINAIPGSVASDPAVASTLKDSRSKARSVNRIIVNIKKGGANNQFNALVGVQMTALETDLSRLADLLTAKGLPQLADTFSAQRSALEAPRMRIKSTLAGISTAAAQKKADQDFAAADQVLRAFLYQLNIYSIAPVAVFDVARVWPINTPARYAAGGGVRLSLVNVNLTLAYAANPVRRAGEGSGAFFMKLDVENLFH